jgi:two-component system sensor histidine kinase HydH
MPSLSLKRGLLTLWGSIAAVAVVLAWLVFALGRQGADAQVRRAELQALASCEALQAGYRQAQRLQLEAAPRDSTEALRQDGSAETPPRTGLGGFPGRDGDRPGPPPRDGPAGARHQAALDAVVDLALRDQPGVEGGFWREGAGVIAYAFPTYDGTGIKRDVPQAELARIESLAMRAHASRTVYQEVRPGLRESVVLAACPAPADASVASASSDSDGPRGSARVPPVAWTLTRAATVAGDSIDQLVLALSLLLGFVLASGGWLGWTLTRWGRGLQVIESALATGPRPADTPLVAQATGLNELDRVAHALNDHADRLAVAQADRARLATELAQSERMAALGRLSAGLAHEIRNPLGTVRLKAENALAAPPAARAARAESALQAVLAQTARLEALVASLLALTQPFHVQRQPVRLRDWLAQRQASHHEAAQARGIALELQIDPALAGDEPIEVFDPEPMARALDNLLLNALAHVGPGGRITLAARRADGAAADGPLRDRNREGGPTEAPSPSLRLRVADDGPGVSAAVRERLFEPFTTGRPDGTGLGLALVREIVQAHQGRIRLLAPTATEPGARFEIELPWPAS